jgi:hypothetical protein
MPPEIKRTLGEWRFLVRKSSQTMPATLNL